VKKHKIDVSKAQKTNITAEERKHLLKMLVLS